MRVIVAGGGVMGLLTAWELVQAGCRVSLFDKSSVGTEASWAGGGIVSPLYPWRYGAAVTALASWAQDFYPQLAQHLAARTGIDPEYNGCGLMMLDAGDAAEALAWARQHGRIVVQGDAAEAVALEPHLDCAVNSMMWMPEVGNIRNPRLLQALRAALEHSGQVDFHLHEAVESLLHDAGRVTGVITQAGRYHADAVVVCAGAWTSSLLAGLGFNLPVKPVRGQMLAIQTPVGWLRHIVLRDGTYVIPRKDGLVLAGSTLEFVGFNKNTSDDARAFLWGRACGMLSGVADFPVVGHWAGLRPGSPDGVPFIGELEEQPGLFLNVGHYRNGLVLAPASCRLLTDHILGRAPAIDPAPYLPSVRLRSALESNLEWR